MKLYTFLFPIALLLSACGGGSDGENCETLYRQESKVINIEGTPSVEYSGNIFASTSKNECPNHSRLGEPKTSDELLCNEGYVIGYDNDFKIADWAAYALTDESVSKFNARKNDFREDTRLPEEHRSQLSDFSNSGYDRGHLAPAASIDFSEKSLSESFLLSNIVPQSPSLNGGDWRVLEDWVRDCTIEVGNLDVVTGTISNRFSKKIGNDVSVPDYLYKVVVKTDSPAQAIAFLVPNKEDNTKEIKDYIVSISDLERRFDLDFLGNLKYSVSNELKGMKAAICDIPNFDDVVVIGQEISTLEVPYEVCTSADSSGSCCKVCRKGKACGNSCISVDKTCHKSGGCACNG